MTSEYALPIRLTNPEEILDLEEDCRFCKGSGLDPKYKKPESCKSCCGTGIRLTKMGKKLLEFMKRHLDKGAKS